MQIEVHYCNSKVGLGYPLKALRDARGRASHAAAEFGQQILKQHCDGRFVLRCDDRAKWLESARVYGTAPVKTVSERDGRRSP
ncbi:MAG TPA: hypothetical protein VFO87_05120 [Nitrospira sp.]|nr:hypothetical protein [Nitrospira sp.]